MPASLAIEAGLILALGLAFGTWRPLRHWCGGMPRVHRAIFLAFLGAMVAGHFTPDGRTYFPFTRWDIFGYLAEEDPVTCRELWASTASGKGVRLLVEQLFPSIVQFNLPRGNTSPAMTNLVEALTDRYNAQHPDDPVRQVDLVSIAVKLHPAGSSERPLCEILTHYEVSPVPSP